MQESLLQFKKLDAPEVLASDEIPVDKLPRFAADWLVDCQIRQHSPRTIELRRMLLERLQWFLENRKQGKCGRAEIRSFFAYLAGGHQEPCGRWGKAERRYTVALRPATINTYYQHLKTFFSWLVAEEYLSVSPMAKLAPPVDRPDQIKPFTGAQVTALLNAAQKTKYAKRDEAILRFLLDTGVRVTELCQLKMRDLDLMEGQAYVLGKGNKRRLVCFGRKTARALRAYLKDEDRTPDQCVFLSERGKDAGEPFLRGGILQLFERLGKAARIQGVRCSPHTCRHYFAVEFLKAGGNVFALKTLLGHTGLQITNRYVALAEADVTTQHRQFSPGDRV